MPDSKINPLHNIAGVDFFFKDKFTYLWKPNRKCHGFKEDFK